jgi:murein DD-endopeptidase MepM/ murein hydrolase activator NlpD
MIYPVDPSFPITQKFGENPDWYPTTHGHPGIDFGCPVGTPVKSVFSGQVVFAGLDPETVADSKRGYGLHVRIQGSQYLAIYGHFSVAMVSKGDIVVEGAPIGLTGNTGFSTGPHLHFELRTAAANALTCFDPLPLLNQSQQPDRKPLFYAVITCDALNIRRDPSRSHAVAGTLKMGDVIPVYSIEGSEVWVEHDRGFSAWHIDGEDLMKVQ